MEVWMGRLWIKAAECKYKENDSILKEQFISGMNGDAITAETTKEFMVLKDTTAVSSAQVLSLAQMVKVQRVWKTVLDNLRDMKYFD